MVHPFVEWLWWVGGGVYFVPIELRIEVYNLEQREIGEFTVSVR